MSGAWTKGPWRIERDDRPGMHWNNHIYGADGMCVCFMTHDGTEENIRSEANARLIAAAPEMVAIIRRLVSSVRSPDALNELCAEEAESLLARLDGGGHE